CKSGEFDAPFLDLRHVGSDCEGHDPPPIVDRGHMGTQRVQRHSPDPTKRVIPTNRRYHHLAVSGVSARERDRSSVVVEYARRVNGLVWTVGGRLSKTIHRLTHAAGTRRCATGWNRAAPHCP